MREEQQRTVRESGMTLRVDGIRMRIGLDPAAEPCELMLEPGTLTFVMGSNGAGKTTWLEKLAGLRDPEGLRIRYGVEPLWRRRKFRPGWRLNPAALLQYGYGSQSSEQALFARSVKEELLYSLGPYARSLGSEGQKAEMNQAVEAVGFDSSWLLRDPFRMSGGERRRTALASLFVTPAAWLLLDEPTAGLDREGHERVAGHLQQLKQEARGIILVSHDLDWALPLADQVLILNSSGEFRICRVEDLVDHLEWIEEAGMRVPVWLRVVQQARYLGVPLERLWNPTEAADAITECENFDELGEWIGQEKASCRANQPGIVKAGRPLQTIAHRLTRLDPRAVWLSYAILAAGLFSLSNWLGMAVGALVVCGLLFAGNVSLRRWTGVIGSFLSFGFILSCFAAVVTQGDGHLWDKEAFTGTLFPFARTLLVLLIGLALPLVMTPLSLRRTLEQLVSWRGKTTAFWQKFILTVMIMMRFVTVLLAEWERFGRIFLARGKETGKTPRVLLRRLWGVALPFLLALFRLGDDVATALESRGVRMNINPTRGTHLNWKWTDTALIASAAILSGVLWFWV
jgi:energy-coupling factor transporter ATP-binding protein EcfA2/energy-coupling factor transporter transmembrane protein EcfT